MPSEDAARRQQAEAKMNGEVDKARTHIVEDMSVGQNCDLIMISTNENLILAEGVTVRDRSRCWGGHMSDASVQQLSRDRKAA
jgi:hypothetical protein